MTREEIYKEIEELQDKLNTQQEFIKKFMIDSFNGRSCDGCKHYIELVKGKSETICCAIALDCIRKYEPKDRWESKQ